MTTNSRHGSDSVGLVLLFADQTGTVESLSSGSKREVLLSFVVASKPVMWCSAWMGILWTTSLTQT